MFAWKCGVFLLLAVRANGANGANGMEAKQEPEEFDEDLAHALAVSLQDANGLEGQQEPEEFDDLLAHALAVSLREAGMASPDADDQELEDDPYMEVLSTDREDLFADSAEECAAVEDGQGSEEDLEFLAAEEGPPAQSAGGVRKCTCACGYRPLRSLFAVARYLAAHGNRGLEEGHPYASSGWHR